jgi:hypothetical protein
MSYVAALKKNNTLTVENRLIEKIFYTSNGAMCRLPRCNITSILLVPDFFPGKKRTGT